MSKAAKNGGSPGPAATDLQYEDALKKLERIVEEMESEDLPLEKLLARFEEGTRLAKACQDKLADAELKIQQLETTQTGGLAAAPLTLDSAEK